MPDDPRSLDGPEFEPGSPRRGAIDRRAALKVFGGTGVTLGALTRFPGAASRRAAFGRALLESGHFSPEISGPVPSLSFVVYRRDDLFDLQFDCYNLKLVSGALVRISTHLVPYVVVTFPMQYIGEQAVSSVGTPPWMATPVGAYAAGPSQLVFAVPAAVTSIPFTMAGMLDWSKLAPVLTTAAKIVASGLGGPGQLATFIEAPWQLWLSPSARGQWHHSATPVTHGQWTELWQTRLGLGAVEPPGAHPPITAIWAPQWPNLGPADPFLMPLQNIDRRDIVTLSSGGTNTQTGAPIPAIPIPANLFMLTPLGASMNLDGRWNEPTVSSLIEWAERMTTGRDSYVKVVRAGFIYPFRHKAVWIVITDREFQVSPEGDVVAYLVQKNYVKVTQPSVTYSGHTPEPWNGRQMPLRTIVSKTEITPVLDAPSFITTNEPQGAFWPMASGIPVPFSFRGTDFDGKVVDFTTNVIWVDEEVAFDTTLPHPNSIDNIEAEYSSGPNVARRSATLNGQNLAFAPSLLKEPGATSHHAVSLEFDGLPITSPLAHDPAWYPGIRTATLRIPAAEQVTGGELPGSPPVFAYDTVHYLPNGFKAGVPEIFLMGQGTSAALSFPADKSGGAVTPNFKIDGLSRQHGPTADSANVLNKVFNPQQYFGGLEAKILGGLDLFSIISSILGPGGSNLPKIKAHLVFPSNNTKLAPTGLLTTVSWAPQVQGDPLGVFAPKGSTKITLKIKVKIFVPFNDPANTTFQVNGSIVNFDVNLFGEDSKGGLTFLNIHFNKLHLSAKTGAKTHFDVSIGSVNFEGPLSFIQDLEQFFASLGGPSIDIQPSGLTVSYSLPLPSISVGVLAIENISLGGSLVLPFDGSPVRLKVNFCTRNNPFLLSIYFFTGGGFFGIALGTDGIELIEVSLEFGAALSMDLGVASGGVSIMAGIYFSLAANPHGPPAEIVTLTGFLQASGNLEVLGIISISIVFYLGFTYQSPGKCTGTASVMVTVKVLFFSASVTLTVTKTFGGSGDPTFAQAISQSDWDTYCAAFA